ncbi:RNA polymerase sigma-70 factor, ECF subfamily [Pedobacter antarcticus]|nr:sigma-70 family RNA polymerase sigma factor [Pedobacter antarcticus]SFF45855.1 RNA polymerase sigma-70 factor, ECF subfamily [Pedobacter antarcticus]
MNSEYFNESEAERSLDQFSAADKADLKVFFFKYYKLLCVQAFYLLDDEMEAEDLVQDLIINFWQENRFRQIQTNFKAYLQQAVYRRCLHVIDKRKVRLSRMDDYAHNYLNREYYQDGIERKELAMILDSALNELPQQRFEVFKLVCMENKKYQDAANELGISINSVKTHLKLAIKGLRKRLFFLKN